MRALLLLLPLILGQYTPVQPFEHRNLDPKTRPAVEIALFKKLPCVTVSQFRAKDGGKIVVTRVYRFTYKANLKAEVARMQKALVAKGDWKRDPDWDARVIFSRPVKHPKIKGQSVVLQGGRWVADRESPNGTRKAQDAGYVAVSLNETLK